jgi:putative tryptophan/tyrosine transport system substrate-binding protein
MANRSLDAIDGRRRRLAALAGLPTLAWLDTLHAQAKAPALIGWLNNAHHDEDRLRDAFVQGMAELGWKPGIHYVLEQRHANGRQERLLMLAQELAAKRPALIVATPSSSVRAAMAAAPTTPIVVANGDPLATGLVSNLARPGGMVTGVSNQSNDASVKVVELLVESMPKLQRVGFLVDSSVPNRGTGSTQAARRAAQRARVEAAVVGMAGPEDIDAAFARLAKDGAQALVLMASNWFALYINKIMPLALAQSWPVVGNLHGIPAQGGLLSFGADSLVLAKRSAFYVDRILKGAKPGDLPIEQPTSFRMVLNMKTAKQLGISFPQSMLLRATEVIQ